MSEQLDPSRLCEVDEWPALLLDNAAVDWKQCYQPAIVTDVRADIDGLLICGHTNRLDFLKPLQSICFYPKANKSNVSNSTNFKGFPFRSSGEIAFCGKVAELDQGPTVDVNVSFIHQSTENDNEAKFHFNTLWKTYWQTVLLPSFLRLAESTRSRRENVIFQERLESDKLVVFASDWEIFSHLVETLTATSALQSNFIVRYYTYFFGGKLQYNPDNVSSILLRLFGHVKPSSVARVCIHIGNEMFKPSKVLCWKRSYLLSILGHDATLFNSLGSFTFANGQSAVGRNFVLARFIENKLSLNDIQETELVHVKLYNANQRQARLSGNVRAFQNDAILDLLMLGKKRIDKLKARNPTLGHTETKMLQHCDFQAMQNWARFHEYGVGGRVEFIFTLDDIGRVENLLSVFSNLFKDICDEDSLVELDGRLVARILTNYVQCIYKPIFKIVMEYSLGKFVSPSELRTVELARSTLLYLNTGSLREHRHVLRNFGIGKGLSEAPRRTDRICFLTNVLSDESFGYKVCTVDESSLHRAHWSYYQSWRNALQKTKLFGVHLSKLITENRLSEATIAVSLLHVLRQDVYDWAKNHRPNMISGLSCIEIATEKMWLHGLKPRLSLWSVEKYVAKLFDKDTHFPIEFGYPSCVEMSTSLFADTTDEEYEDSKYLLSVAMETVLSESILAQSCYGSRAFQNLYETNLPMTHPPLPRGKSIVYDLQMCFLCVDFVSYLEPCLSSLATTDVVYTYVMKEVEVILRNSPLFLMKPFLSSEPWVAGIFALSVVHKDKVLTSNLVQKGRQFVTLLAAGIYLTYVNENNVPDNTSKLDKHLFSKRRLIKLNLMWSSKIVKTRAEFAAYFNRGDFSLIGHKSGRRISSFWPEKTGGMDLDSHKTVTEVEDLFEKYYAS